MFTLASKGTDTLLLCDREDFKFTHVTVSEDAIYGERYSVITYIARRLHEEYVQRLPSVLAPILETENARSISGSIQAHLVGDPFQLHVARWSNSWDSPRLFM